MLGEQFKCENNLYNYPVIPKNSTHVPPVMYLLSTR